MKIRALKRFNHHAPGEEFEASEADAKKWIANGVAEAAKDANQADDGGKKGADAPPADKTAKGAKTK